MMCSFLLKQQIEEVGAVLPSAGPEAAKQGFSKIKEKKTKENKIIIKKNEIK